MEGRGEEKQCLLLNSLGEKKMWLLKTFGFKPMSKLSLVAAQAKATDKSHFDKPRV